MMPRGTREVAPPEACPAAAIGVKLRPAAPVAEAPEAPTILHEAAPGGVLQGNASNTDHLDASSSPQVDPCDELLGRFRVYFRPSKRGRKPWVEMITPAAY